jgi:plastocyanin
MQNKCLALTIILIVAAIMLFSTPVIAENTAITEAYIEAYDTNDQEKILKVIVDNEEKVPAEIKTLIYSTMGANVEAEKKESTLYIAEQMAISYKEVTGDFEPLRGVKREQFESKISEPVISVAVNGVHTIETPKETDGRYNFFSPDNIVIKKGETVSWHNTDHIAHLFASFSIIGKGGLFTPNIDPGATWEYTFEEAGEYYYLCFIHKGMLGKITVEE